MPNACDMAQPDIFFSSHVLSRYNASNEPVVFQAVSCPEENAFANHALPEEVIWSDVLPRRRVKDGRVDVNGARKFINSDSFRHPVHLAVKKVAAVDGGHRSINRPICKLRREQ